MLGLGVLLVVIVSVLIVVFFTQFLWNFVMPDVFGVKKLEFSQTLALLVLSGIFFGCHCNASSVYTMNNMVV